MPAVARPPRHWGALAVYAGGFAASSALFGVNTTLAWVAGALNLIFFAFFCRHFAFAVAAARWATADLDAPDVDLDGYTPRVAVFVGCKNEELVVDAMVTALLGLDYPHDKLTLVVVDDGSDDATGAILDTRAAADARLTVLHRAAGSGGGKSGALNDALALVRQLHSGDPVEVAVVFDADHEPEPASLRRLVRHLRDPQVSAVMGRCAVRNGAESPLAATVFIDYLSGYLVNQYGRQALFELPAYGGANCAVRMSVLISLGGWNPDTVTEDTDLTLRVLLDGGRVRYDASAVDFEEAVVSMRRFHKQRYRWSRGHQKCLRDYWWPVVKTPHLTWTEKLETIMFLWVYHVPMLCGLGLLLTVLRVFGIGGSVSFGLLPLSSLMFAGPLTELMVGLLVGGTARRSAWTLIGFLPAFAMSIAITSKAWIDGMIGRPYTWVKTARTGATHTAR